MAELQLEAARESVAGLMQDACTITRSVAGVFNPDTGEYDAGVSSIVFTGPTFITPPKGTEEVEVEGGKRELERLYHAKIPHDATMPKINDIFTCTACVYDPEMVGRQMTVVEIRAGSVLIWRDLALEYEEGA